MEEEKQNAGLKNTDSDAKEFNNIIQQYGLSKRPIQGIVSNAYEIYIREYENGIIKIGRSMDHKNNKSLYIVTIDKPKNDITVIQDLDALRAKLASIYLNN